MKSMTGYGRGQVVAKGVQVLAEISSVNHRQLDLRLDLPQEFAPFEPEIRRLLRARLARGAATCRLRLARGNKAVVNAVAGFDAAAVTRVLSQVLRLGRRLKLKNDLAISHLLTAAALTVTAPPVWRTEELFPPARRALRQALAGLEKMRRREGRALAADLASRLEKIQRACQKLIQGAPRVAAAAHRRLKQKLRAWHEAMPQAAPERWEREVAAAVMRGDIAEELTRLKSHLAQAGKCLAVDQPVGRQLDFLSQEMLREINTVAAKIDNLQMSRIAMQIKLELERVREQVQNVE